MWWLNSLIPAFLVLPLTGCVGIGAVAPTEERDPEFQHNLLTELVGENKASVAERLGAPDHELLGDGESYFVYEAKVNVAGAGVIGIVPVPLWGDVDRCSKLVFDAQDTLSSFELAGGPVLVAFTENYSPPPNCLMLLFGNETAMKKLQDQTTAADNIEMMYQYGKFLWMPGTYQTQGKVDATFYWYCQAAHGGHKSAQVVVRSYYKNGWGSVPSDPVQAYVWASLVYGPKHSREHLSHHMTPAQIAEAERLAAEWQPNPAECEAYDVARER